MDEEMSRRIRQVLKDAVDRQRPQPDSEAAKRQTLVSTLRLAGHMVSLIADDPPMAGDAAQADDGAPADDAMPADETAAQDDAAAQDDNAPPAVFTQPGAPAPPGQPLWSNPLVHDGLDRLDDPARPADYGKPQLLPYTDTNPTLPAFGGLHYPQPTNMPQPYRVSPGPSIGDPAKYPVPGGEPDSASPDLEITPVASDGFSPPAADPITSDAPLGSDAPPALSIRLDGDSASSPTPSAPGVKLFHPSPGALSFSFPSSTDEDRGDGAGGSSQSGDEGGSIDGPAPADQPAIVVEPTEILTDQLIRAATEAISPLVQKTVDLAISDLRHEIYVSRAAWNALFPR